MDELYMLGSDTLLQSFTPQAVGSDVKEISVQYLNLPHHARAM